MSQGVLGYQDFLAARDGEADLARHTLSRGEGFFAELARRPVRSGGADLNLPLTGPSPPGHTLGRPLQSPD